VFALREFEGDYEVREVVSKVIFVLCYFFVFGDVNVDMGVEVYVVDRVREYVRGWVGLSQHLHHYDDIGSKTS
jgi:hypothetical protein